jgi:hypothetical protein
MCLSAGITEREEWNPDRKDWVTVQLNLVQAKWLDGFGRDPSVNGSLTQDGVPCIPGECC